MADERKSVSRTERSPRTGKAAPEKSHGERQPGPDRTGEERWRGRSAEPDSWVGQPDGSRTEGTGKDSGGDST